MAVAQLRTRYGMEEIKTINKVFLFTKKNQWFRLLGLYILWWSCELCFVLCVKVNKNAGEFTNAHQLHYFIQYLRFLWRFTDCTNAECVFSSAGIQAFGLTHSFADAHIVTNTIIIFQCECIFIHICFNSQGFVSIYA